MAAKKKRVSRRMETILKVPGVALFDQDKEEEEEEEEQEDDPEGFQEIVADGVEEEEDAKADAINESNGY